MSADRTNDERNWQDEYYKMFAKWAAQDCKNCYQQDEITELTAKLDKAADIVVKKDAEISRLEQKLWTTAAKLEIARVALEIYANNDVYVAPSDWRSFKEGGPALIHDYEECSHHALEALAKLSAAKEGE